MAVHCCDPIRAQPWYFCTCCIRPRQSTPSPNDDTQEQEYPSNVYTSFSGGHIRIVSLPVNGASTITTPSPTPSHLPSNLRANSDGTSYSSPSPPATECQDLQWKRSRAKREVRTLRPCLATSEGQGRPHTPPTHCLYHRHPSAC